MRTQFLRAREPFDNILRNTLQRGWSTQLQSKVEVSSSPRPGAQTWFHQPLLSGYFSASPSPHVLHFMAESLRRTPRLHRKIPQWLMATTLATPIALQAFKKPEFCVTPALPHANDLLVVPGNQRIRIFDFKRRCCRVLLKEGFDNRTLLTEIRVRRNQVGPFPPVLDTDQTTWFEEPILNGFALPRAPLLFDRAVAMRKAFSYLDQWASPTLHVASTSNYLDALLELSRARLDLVRERFSEVHAQLNPLDVWLERLAERASDYPYVDLCDTHGDFQPGNVMWDRDAKDIVIIDWEHARTRSRLYDRLVCELESRFLSGLSIRLAKRLGRSRALSPNLALFLLEDLEWYISESTTGPFTQPSAGLMLFIDELTQHGPTLDPQIFGSRAST